MARAATKTKKPAAKAKPAAKPAPAKKVTKPAKPPSWQIKGELALNCSCDVFCPCVVSLGQHPPTHGYCHAWLAVRIDEGHFGRTKLSGLNIALLLDIPGKMGDGDWKAAAYVDAGATDTQFDSLIKIFSGQVGGTTGVLRLLVSEFLGARREEVGYDTDGKTRIVTIPGILNAMVAPIPGGSPDEDVMLKNTQYWMGPDVTLAKGLKSRIRDYGRVWSFDNKSAEIMQIDWHN